MKRPVYEALQDNSVTAQRMMGALLYGVSRRQYEEVLPEMGDTTGVSRSSVSRQAIEGSAQQLRQLRERRWDRPISWRSTWMASVSALTSVISAVGVDREGTKHVLGIQPGATENAAAVETTPERFARTGPTNGPAVSVRHRRSESLACRRTVSAPASGGKAFVVGGHRLPHKTLTPFVTFCYHHSTIPASITQCFRECDVRGKYPAELNEEVFRAIGSAIGRRWRGGGVFVIGRDVRRGSPALELALVDGIVRSGGHVIDLGCVPTPIVCFARRYYRAQAGVVVTASHNPPEYNGLKLLLPDGPPNHKDILGLRDSLNVIAKQQSGGFCEVADVIGEYVGMLERFWRRWTGSVGPQRTPRLVADPGGGSWSKIAGNIFSRLGVDCRMLHDEPDCTFRDRSPDCACPTSLKQLGVAVRNNQAEAGLAWDGDGDRFAAVDSSGNPITADQMGLILAASMPLEGERILLDVKISRKVSVAIRKLGGVPVVDKSAHCALERTMIEQDCTFGCEYSGHYFFRDLHGADDGLYAALRFVSLLRCHESLESMMRKLPRFCVTPDIRVSAEPSDFDTLRTELLKSASFGRAAISEVDGLKLDLPEGWLLVRRSVSEDKLSLRAEGETPTDLVRIIRLFLSVLPAKYEEMRFRLEPWSSVSQICC